MSEDRRPYLPRSARAGWIAAMLVAGLALVASAIPAIASATASSTVFHACVTNKTGVIKIVSGSSPCASGQHMISWNNIGPRGATGKRGPAGVSTGYFASDDNSVALDDIAPTRVAGLSLPAGNYLVTVTVTAGIVAAGTVSDIVTCNLTDPSQVVKASVGSDISETGLGAGDADISVTAPVDGGGNVVLTCTDGTGQATAFDRVITAVPVRTLKFAPTS